MESFTCYPDEVVNRAKECIKLLELLNEDKYLCENPDIVECMESGISILKSILQPIAEEIQYTKQ